MIHDFVCSWCAVGKHHLNAALKELGGNIEVEWSFIPKELNPLLGKDGIGIQEYFTQCQQWSEDKFWDYRKALLDVIEKNGVNIDFRFRTHYYNTQLAHRLLAAAEIKGCHFDIHELILNAYHARGYNIGDADILKTVLENANFDTALLFELAAPDSELIQSIISEKEERIKSFPITSIPAFIFNDSDFVSGSNSKAYFINHFKSNYLTKLSA